MKKLLFIFALLIAAFVANAQYPYGRLYNPNQRLGSDSALVTSYGGLKGRLVVWNFTDTTAANLQAIKNYSGAFIFTTDSNRLWVRNRDINKWLRSGGDATGGITSITFLTDSSMVICFSDGSCDTVGFVNNIFVTNNNVQILNDSTLIICDGAGSCDTIDLDIDNIQNFFFLNDSTVVVCDSLETICIGDSCFTQQICDTINIPRITNLQFQNLVRRLPNSLIVEGGDSQFTTEAYMQHDTYYYTRGYQLQVLGLTSERPPFYVRQDQWSQLSSSAVGFSHFGRYPNQGLIDSANAVSLYLNYFDPFVGDTNGFFGDRIGYAWMTNSRGRQENYFIEDDSSKQVGILFHTLDVENTDGVTIFAQQVPSAYNFGNNPPVDSNLLSKRIMVFKTDQDYQVPNYPNTRNDGAAALAFYPDADGNVKLGAVAGSGDITIINDTTIVICSFGEFLCDTFITVQNPVQLVFVINDSTLLVCDTLFNCDTLHLGGGAPGFDRGFFDPNQNSIGDTRHQTNGNDLAVGRNYTLSPTGTSDNFLFGNGSVINANATRNFVAISNNTVSGSENTVFGRNMVVSGNTNFVAATDGTVASANYSATFGDANDQRGTASLLMGFGNNNFVENGFTGGSDNNNGAVANVNSNTFVYGLQNTSLGSRSFVGGQLLTATGNNITMFGTNYTSTTASSFNVGYGSLAFEITALKVRTNLARFQEAKGSTTASANDLTLPNDGNLTPITGSIQINAITTTNWQAGSTIGLIFTGAPLLKHNTAGGAGTATMLLAGSVDFQAAAGDNIEFRYDGTNWHEIGRTLAGAAPGSVTSFSFTDANGFDGTVTNPTTTPNLTLTTTLTQGSVFFAGAAGAINEDNTNFFFDNTNDRLGIGTNSFAGSARRLEIVDNAATTQDIVEITSTSLSSGRGINVSINSTAAASGTQRAIYASLSGANATGSQRTYTIWGENTHTGSGFNTGVSGSATGGANNFGVLGSDGTGMSSSPGNIGVAGAGAVGVYGFTETLTGVGVQGTNIHATNGIGVLGQANGSAGQGVNGSSSAGFGVVGSSVTGTPVRAQLAPSAATPSTVTTMLEILNTSNTIGNVPGNGYGGNILWTIITNNGGSAVSRTAGDLYVKWLDVTDASRTADMTFDITTDADNHNTLLLSGAQTKLYSRDAATNQTAERYHITGTYKALTEASATAFVRVNVPTGTGTGGEVIITVQAEDATDFQARTLRFAWSAVNKAGTITANVATPEESVAVSTGTLTVTIDTNDAGSGNLDFRANATSSLTQTALRCSYQVVKNIGSGTITPQ